MSFLLKTKHKLTRLFILLIALPFKPINELLIRKYGGGEIKYQPVFIIGAPRTGSTILYQSITNQANVLYINNLVCRFYSVFFLGFWLSQKCYGNKAHNCFQSSHGDTKRYGLNAPSECGEFWYRWLRGDRHFVDESDLESIDFNRIKREITAVTNFFNKPIVFKNLNAGQRMRLIHKIFPGAKFIFVRRDPIYTTQSILKAKRKIGIREDKFWSIMPRNVEELSRLDWAQQIVGQIYYIEKQIANDSKLFCNNSFISIDYKNLSSDTVTLIIDKLKFRHKKVYRKPLINVSEKICLLTDETLKINKEIGRYDWSITEVK